MTNLISGTIWRLWTENTEEEGQERGEAFYKCRQNVVLKI